MQNARPFRAHDEHLDEGDIIANAPVLVWREGQPTFVSNRVIVTSNGCACEDYERAIEKGREQAARKIMIMVAPLQNATIYPAETREAIQAGEYYDRFYVFGDRGKLRDQVVDFTREFHIPATLLAACTKIARLETWQWRRLLIQQSVSRFHQKPEEIFVDPQLDAGSASDAA